MSKTVDMLLELKKNIVAHRDIKPNNFYLTKDNTFKL